MLPLANTRNAFSAPQQADKDSQSHCNNATVTIDVKSSTLSISLASPSTWILTPSGGAFLSFLPGPLLWGVAMSYILLLAPIPRVECRSKEEQPKRFKTWVMVDTFLFPEEESSTSIGTPDWPSASRYYASSSLVFLHAITARWYVCQHANWRNCYYYCSRLVTEDWEYCQISSQVNYVYQVFECIYVLSRRWP